MVAAANLLAFRPDRHTVEIAEPLSIAEKLHIEERLRTAANPRTAEPRRIADPLGFGQARHTVSENSADTRLAGSKRAASKHLKIVETPARGPVHKNFS